MEETKERVIVSRPWCGLFHMQVCCVKDATDEEILEVCNRENPAGTTNGWVIVVRDDTGKGPEGPKPCAEFSERLHILVEC